MGAPSLSFTPPTRTPQLLGPLALFQCKEWLGLTSEGPSTLLGHLPLVGAHGQCASISLTPESGDTLYFAGSLWGERRALHWVLFLPVPSAQTHVRGLTCAHT